MVVENGDAVVLRNAGDMMPRKGNRGEKDVGKRKEPPGGGVDLVYAVAKIFRSKEKTWGLPFVVGSVLQRVYRALSKTCSRSLAPYNGLKGPACLRHTAVNRGQKNSVAICRVLRTRLALLPFRAATFRRLWSQAVQSPLRTLRPKVSAVFPEIGRVYD